MTERMVMKAIVKIPSVEGPLAIPASEAEGTLAPGEAADDCGPRVNER